MLHIFCFKEVRSLLDKDQYRVYDIMMSSLENDQNDFEL